MRLVLDTNIIISAFINPKGIPSQILRLVLQQKAELFYNTYILSEYENVMKRPKFSDKIDKNLIVRFINLIKSIGISYDPIPSNIKLPDEKDRIFYDTAKGSSSLLITGNIKHYPKEPFIMQPSEFMQRCT